jgi:hypothetical protein
MKELFMLVATITPEDVIIKELEQALSDYKVLNDKDSKNAVLMNCQMLILNHMTQGSPDKMTEMLQKMDQTEQRDKLFDINNLS